MDNSLSRRIPALPRRCSQPLAAAFLSCAAALALAAPALATDTASPTVTVTAPAVNANYTSLSAVTGTAADDTGLKRIEVYLYRSYTGVKQYFNFSTRAWGTAAPATLSVTPDPNTTGNPITLSWSVTGATWPTSAEMPAGAYNMEVRSVDTSNKTSAYVRPLFTVGTPDSTAPTAAYTSPTADVTDDHFPATWSATGNDGSGSGIGYVQFSIYRRFSSTIEYWSGNATTGWTTTKTLKTLTPSAPDANGDQTWSYSLNAGDWPAPTGANLPQGQYTVAYNVYDRYGNLRTINRLVYILPVDSIKPVSVITSPANPADKTDVVNTSPASITGYSYDPLDENGAASGVASTFVGIFRTWKDANPYYWDGTGWTLGVKTYPVTLGAPDASGHCAWSFPPAGVAMPALTQGAYTLRVNTNDRYGNAGVTLQQPLYVGPSDVTAPTAAVTNPAINTPVSALSSVTGTATDAGSGVSRLEITLSRTRAGTTEYWGGAAWGSSIVKFTPTIGTPDAGGTVTWDLSTAFSGGAALPSGTNLPGGKYNVGITVGDRYLNLTTVTSPFLVTNASGIADTAAPSATITAPANGAVVQSLDSITGTAADDGAPAEAQTGLSEVQVVLTRILASGNLTWNGSAWVTGTTYLSPRAASGTSTNWSRTGLPSGTNLPAGQYSVTVTALDQALNASAVATANFTVDARPAAQAQSVTATGRLTSEGDPASITLTATDPDGDAIQGWRVVTQPAHGTLTGTLTGTAPNLTYVAEQGYFGSDSFTFAASDGTLESDPATVSLTVSAPPPVDALIKNPSDPSYTGDNLTSSDGTNETVGQTVFAGEKATYLIKVQNETDADSLVLKVLGTGESNGWTVRYYDAHTNGLDITDDVTSTTGWHPTLTGTDTSFRVEVTPPANLAEDTNLALLVTAEQDNTAGSLDAVKAVTTGKPSKQPDIFVQGINEYLDFEPLEQLDELPPLPVIGQNVFSSNPEDQQCLLPSTGTRRTYTVTVRNAGSTTATYRLSGVITQDGWAAKYFDGGTDNELTSAIEAGTYELTLTPGQQHQLRAEVATESMAAPDQAALSLTARDGASVAGQWQPGTWVDTAELAVQAQSLAGVEYSLDAGTTWQPYTGELTVPRLAVVGFRGIPATPGVPWRSTPVAQPVWSHNGEEPCGETVWLQFKTVGTEPLSGQCRTTVSGTVTVVERTW